VSACADGGIEAGTGNCEAKAHVLHHWGARMTLEAAAKAAQTASLQSKSAEDLQAHLQFLTQRGWQVQSAPVDVLRKSLDWLVTRVLFAEEHRWAQHIG
jgi:hypothetical protein